MEKTIYILVATCDQSSIHSEADPYFEAIVYAGFNRSEVETVKRELNAENLKFVEESEVDPTYYTICEKKVSLPDPSIIIVANDGVVENVYAKGIDKADVSVAYTERMAGYVPPEDNSDYKKIY